MMSVNRSLLTVARESRRITQKQLADRIGVAQGTVSKAENGTGPAPDELAAAYASALDYPASFFYQDLEAHSLPLTLFRKRKRIPAADLKAIQAQRNILRLHVKQLVRSVAVPEMRVPMIDLDGAPTDAAGFARDVRIRWHMPDGPVGNLTKMLENAGVVVVACDFGTDKVDALSFYEPEDMIPPVIMVDMTKPGDRIRYTLAHELAHIALHHHLSMVPIECEDEADAFAGEFLMPASKIRGSLSGRLTIDRLVSLKRYWRVSMAALLVRARKLNCITERKYKSMWMRMGKLGFRTREPGEIDRSEPTLMSQIIRFHIDDLGYSEEELCNALCLGSSDFHSKYPGVSAKLRLVQ